MPLAVAVLGTVLSQQWRRSPLLGQEGQPLQLIHVIDRRYRIGLIIGASALGGNRSCFAGVLGRANCRNRRSEQHYVRCAISWRRRALSYTTCGFCSFRIHSHWSMSFRKAARNSSTDGNYRDDRSRMVALEERSVAASADSASSHSFFCWLRLPASFRVPIAAFEHRLYLPMLAFSVLAAVLLAQNSTPYVASDCDIVLRSWLC